MVFGSIGTRFNKIQVSEKKWHRYQCPGHTYLVMSINIQKYYLDEQTAVDQDPTTVVKPKRFPGAAAAGMSARCRRHPVAEVLSAAVASASCFVARATAVVVADDPAKRAWAIVAGVELSEQNSNSGLRRPATKDVAVVTYCCPWRKVHIEIGLLLLLLLLIKSFATGAELLLLLGRRGTGRKAGVVKQEKFSDSLNFPNPGKRVIKSSVEAAYLHIKQRRISCTKSPSRRLGYRSTSDDYYNV
uniref:Uncharacterized protein n=1 Tax=Romanomermis culicivorax TaxID=13658 RepID=A0A915HM96_ROMCU